MAVVLRAAIQRDPRSLYAIAKAAGLHYQRVHPFVTRRRENITLETADRLCRVLGLELTPTNRKARSS